MKFSIVTVTFNAGEKLKETVLNSLEQTYSDYEIIVKDGGSTDNSTEAIKTLNSEKVKIIINKDKGIYDAMNEAVKEALGDFIIFMNAGDKFYDKDVLKNVADKNLPLLNTIAYGDAYFLNTEALQKPSPKITGFTCYRNVPCHQAILYSRDTLLNRGFDTSYKIRADFEHFNYSYFKAHQNFFYLDLPVCLYEGGGVSESKANKRIDKAEYKRAVKANIPFSKRFVYRTVLILTLYKLRGKIARNPKTAQLYESLKRKLYS